MALFDIFMNITANDWNALLKSRGEIAKELEGHSLAVKGLERENAAQKEEIEWLRELLAPFAKEGKTWGQPHATKSVGICELGFNPVEAEFTVDDLKAAADYMSNVNWAGLG